MTAARRPQPVAVFSTVYGQQDNLGDSVLRRGLLNAVRSEESEFHLYVGDCSDDFLSALDLREEDRLYSDRAAWRRALIQHAVRRRAAYLFNAGESGASGRYVSWGTVALLAAVRLGGGRVVQSGVGLRRPYAAKGFNLRVVLLLTSLVTWRDPASAAAAGKGTVEPDWAFALGRRTDATGARDLLAVSMRGDREPAGESWHRVLRELADGEGLRLVAVSQVRRDNERTQQLAEALGCAADLWEDDADHRAREAQVRDIYRRCRGVISDRLHVLIIGATEGAQPLGYVATTLDKIRRTLEPVGWAEVCFAPDAENPQADREKLSRLLSRSGVLQATTEARRRLDVTATLLRRTLAPNRRIVSN
ncbi:hypothetical protein CXR34_15045 [Microbacterium hominis]|uniref:Polysaccharide pyruvyl transferase domain-containing protein n=1 Tax=Microbacterium hominis TaxID=162426 RepID=A0A2K9DEQ3_9MICO|nr:hypothetical protein CXR34_15045 [Microbacterium hominis]